MLKSISTGLILMVWSLKMGAMEVDFKHLAYSNGQGNENKDARLDYEEDSGITFGRGYDTLSDLLKGDCLEKTEIETPDGSQAQKIVFSIHHVTNSVDLMKKLNLNAALSIKSGWGRGSAKSEFASQYSLSSYSVYVMAKVLVRNVMRTIRYPRLTEQARALYRSSPERFRKACGDEFIGTMTTGGEFYAVLEISTKNESQKTNVMARLNARVGTITGSADFASSLSNITQDYQAKVAVYQIGGKMDPVMGIPTTPEQIIQFAKKFPSTVVGNDSMPISATTFPYTNLTDLPLEVEPMAVQMQEKIIRRMIDYQNSYLTQLANVDYILHNQEQFISPNVSELNSLRNKLLAQTNKVMEVAKLCFMDLTLCEFPEDLEYPTYVLPDRVKGATMKELCELKEDPFCKPILYKYEESEHCGVKEFKYGRGEVCGVELYKLGRSEACGVIRYMERQDPLCGKTHDYITQSFDPGFRNCWVGRENVSPKISTEKGLWDKLFPAKDWDCPRGGMVPHGQSICQNRHSGHWHIICLAQVDSTCRRAEFGVELAELCRAAEHGVERYLPCVNKVFGAESYFGCRDSHHGVEKFDKCYIPKDNSHKDGRNFCSQNPMDYM